MSGKFGKQMYIIILVIMGILYLLYEDIKIPNDNYDIIKDPDLKSTI